MITLKNLAGACLIALPAAAPVGTTTPPSYNASIGIEDLAPSCGHSSTD